MADAGEVGSVGPENDMDISQQIPSWPKRF